ncbi:MAG: ATPase related to the helicase subunit of the Holliday junction resolvase [Candidatus Scalindua rubra]|uniref:Replication-associated recombination protein A n=1 Tax=Candidatus Scalindua rubra TaxID=1872076 RepID=A0A1E3XCU3_9BACT|nr:MAG: ATPase related to the helicase subunit of the Holliday junction resolvase [Candidatus Scalindua rubra]
MDLFNKVNSTKSKISQNLPLAIRMRPKTVEEFVGQKHFFGESKQLRRMLKSDRLTSVLFYGPPGTGKTALAHVIANTTQAHFEEINAAMSNVDQIRKILNDAKTRLRFSQKRTVLFIDELHRFNKAQQDVLLPDVEKGTIILIGATTHNPFFTINSPLISRSQIFQFEPLTIDEMKIIIKRALQDKENGLGNYNIEITEDAIEHLAKMSDGDARRVLNALEVGVLSSKATKDLPDRCQPDLSKRRSRAGKVVLADSQADKKIVYDISVAEESIQKKAIIYDKDEDAHYDAASAFIKSMRGSDPDASLYWMAKMLEAGEDPRFIARRIVICAAEDVGNADPQALILASSALEVSEFVGMPEAKIPLSQAVTYIACAPKSNACYMAIEKALEDVRKERTSSVPKHIRDSSYKGAEKLGHGEGYKYPHKYKDHWVKQEYTPSTRVYYKPTQSGFENTIRERLKKLRKTSSK